MKKTSLATVLIIAGFGFVFFVAIILLAALVLSRDGGLIGLGGDRIAVYRHHSRAGHVRQRDDAMKGW